MSSGEDKVHLVRWTFRVAALTSAMSFVGIVAASAAAAAPSGLCVATNGINPIATGGSTCSADGKGSTAVVVGSNSNARAFDGKHNEAVVVGNDSGAVANDGNKNRAAAVGTAGGTPMASGGGVGVTGVGLHTGVVVVAVGIAHHPIVTFLP
jgi:hypothetical protein